MNLLGHSLSVCENVNEKLGEVNEGLKEIRGWFKWTWGLFFTGVIYKWILSTLVLTNLLAWSKGIL